MMRQTLVCRSNLPVGYFKRIVSGGWIPVSQSPALVPSALRASSRPSKSPRDVFSILRVDSKLVDAKNLNKYLKNVLRRDFARDHLQFLLNYVLAHMPQALDEVNLLTVLLTMSKLDIRDPLLFSSLLPLLYKIRDINKLTDCLLYSSMLFKADPSLRVFATKVICDLPLYADSIDYNNLARLCEALSRLELYSEDFGKFVASLLPSDKLPSKEIGPLNLASILGHLARAGVGDEDAWKMYTKFSLEARVTGDRRATLKLLKAFVDRSMFNRRLFHLCGDSLARSLELMHPADVALASYFYFKVNFRYLLYKHEALLREMLSVGERVATNLDPNSSLRLLSGYYLFFSGLSNPQNALSQLQPSPQLSEHLHCYRAVYLLYNNVANGLNELLFEDFLLLFKTLELFKFINTRNLEASLRVFLSGPAPVNAPRATKADLIKARYRERRLVDAGQRSFIKMLMS